MVASAILAQALLAGLFISATAPVLMAHAIVGSLLSWFASLRPPWQSSGVRISIDELSPGPILLPVGLWVQSTLGHMPFAVGTAIHVPLGCRPVRRIRDPRHRLNGRVGEDRSSRRPV